MITQTALWNGSGNAWVASQDLIDRLLGPIDDVLVEGINPEARVLDVGCGTGGTTLAFARRVRGRCLGIDISGPMLEAARARAERERIAVDFVLGDAARHPFEPESFDAIVSRFGVMFFDDPVAAFRNLRTAAKADGRLRFVAWRGMDDNPFMTTAERAAAPLLPDLPPRRPDEPGQFAFADAERVRRILDKSGWSRIDIQPIDIPCTMAEPDLVRYVSRFGPVGRVLDGVDDSLRGRVIETVRSAFDPYVHGSEVRFTSACWLVMAAAAR